MASGIQTKLMNFKKVRVPPIILTLNVRATSQHNSECCCVVVRTFGVKIIGGIRTIFSNLKKCWL